MIELTDFTFEELSKIITSEFNQPSYRAKQLYAGLSRFQSFDQMSDLPKSLKELLAQNYSAQARATDRSVRVEDALTKGLAKLVFTLVVLLIKGVDDLIGIHRYYRIF